MEEGKQSLNIHVDYWVLKDVNDLSEAFKIGQGRTVCDVATGRLVRSEAWFNGQVSETQEMVRGGQIISEEWIYMVDVYTGVERAE